MTTDAAIIDQAYAQQLTTLFYVFVQGEVTSHWMPGAEYKIPAFHEQADAALKRFREGLKNLRAARDAAKLLVTEDQL